MALTRSLLALDPADVMYFEPLNCHPGGALKASYTKASGEVTLVCAKCGNVVVTLLIAD